MFSEEKARKELEDILNSREYQDYYIDTRNSFEILWDELKAWLADLLIKFFPSLEPTSGMAGSILFVLICILIVALLITFIILTGKRSKNNTFRDQQPFLSKNELDWTYHQHLAEARKQESLEDYTLSARHLFLAMLLFFHEQDWLEARIWKTNWEYYDELKKVQKDSAELFFNFALLFDRATYGEHQIQKKEYDPYRDEALKWLERDYTKV